MMICPCRSKNISLHDPSTYSAEWPLTWTLLYPFYLSLTLSLYYAEHKYTPSIVNIFDCCVKDYHVHCKPPDTDQNSDLNGAVTWLCVWGVCGVFVYGEQGSLPSLKKRSCYWGFPFSVAVRGREKDCPWERDCGMVVCIHVNIWMCTVCTCLCISSWS